MFLELIATFIAGFAAAGVMMLVNRMSGGRLPRWLVPVVAGLAMIGTTIASEYNWFDRTRGTLPNGFEVVTFVETSALYRPWTYVAPLTTRFIALDTKSTRANEKTPSVYLTNIYAYGRWQRVQPAQIMIDCDRLARARPTDGAGDPDWVEVGGDDPIVASVCEAHS